MWETARIAVGLSAYFGAALIGFRRSRPFGIFALVLLGFPTWCGLSLGARFADHWILIAALQLCAAAHFSALALRPRMRGVWFRSLISLPGLWFIAASFLSTPWALLIAIGFDPWLVWLPFVLALFGMVQTLTSRPEHVELTMDCERDAGPLRRWPQAIRRRKFVRREKPGAKTEGPSRLRIVQITDPHLGPFMSVARLKAICQRAVSSDPDLILITGDLMTMESQQVETLLEALSPLAQAAGRVFACHGNHDLEARDVVARVFEKLDVKLLIDDFAQVETRAGSVQIVGADFVWRDRQQHLETLLAKVPRPDDAFRIVLLHDPGAFRHIADGLAPLVLSGHTHGGQVGLLSLGLPHTFVSLISKIPDHGLWAQGKNRLYVHRAQGVYGFPVRIGVPAEQSVLHVDLSSR